MVPAGGMGDGDAVADAKQAQESRQAALTLSPAEPEAPSGAAGYSRRYKIGTTVLYSFTLFATGMGLGGRGAALLSLAKQTGIVDVTTGSGSEEQDIDLSELTMVGWAMVSTTACSVFFSCSL